MAQAVYYIASWLASASVYAKAAVFIIKVAAVYAASRALSPKPGRLGGMGSPIQMTREPAPARRVIYGETRVSGPVAFAHISGEKNENLDIVVLLAGHVCSEIRDIFINDERVAVDGAGSPPLASRYYSKLGIGKWYGDDNARPALVTNTGGVWGSYHRLRGTTALHARMVFDQEIYPQGLPNISAIVRGKIVHDPRTDTSGWSDNPALCVLDFLRDSDIGIGASDSEIDIDSFSYGATICDEPVTTLSGGDEKRYRCSGVFATDGEPAAIIEEMLGTMAASLVYVGGKFSLKIGVYTAPTVTLTESDLRGPIQFQTGASRRDICNIVKGTYTSPGDLYQPRDFPQYVDSTAISADGGEEIPRDIALEWVHSVSQAQRLAAIEGKSSRLGGMILLQCNLSAMRVQVGDTVRIKNQRFGWTTGEVFRVVGFKFSVEEGALGVDLTCQQTASTVYGWTAASDEEEVSDGSDVVNAHGYTMPTGANSAIVMLYKRASSSPASPSTTSTYTFATTQLTGQDNGWTQALPSSNGDPLYAIAATASSVDATDTIASSEWSTPVLIINDGSDGSNGMNTASVFIFKRAASQPSAPSTTSTYTFATAQLSGHDNGWTQAVPANNGDKLWVTTSSAASITATDTIGAGEWATPSVMAENGTDGAAGANGTNGTNGAAGANGVNAVTVFLFQRTASASAPAVPSGTCTYTFSTKTLTGHNNGWATSLPTTGGAYRWQITATALSSTDTDTILAAEWSTPAVSAMDGANGTDGSDATAYWLIASASALNLSGSTFTPGSVVFTGKSQNGVSSPADYSGRFVIGESTDGTNFSTVYTSAGNESAKTWTPSGTTVRAIRCRSYLAGGTTTQVDEETVVIVSDGAPGSGGGGILASVSGNGAITIFNEWENVGGFSATVTIPAGLHSVQLVGFYGGNNESYGCNLSGRVIDDQNTILTSFGSDLPPGVGDDQNFTCVGAFTVSTERTATIRIQLYLSGDLGDYGYVDGTLIIE